MSSPTYIGTLAPLQHEKEAGPTMNMWNKIFGVWHQFTGVVPCHPGVAQPCASPCLCRAAVEHLFCARPLRTGYIALFFLFICYFPLAVWCAGSCVWRAHWPDPNRWCWSGSHRWACYPDLTGDLIHRCCNGTGSGRFALVSSRGVSGSVSLTVIMMEITNDIRFFLMCLRF